MSIAFFLLGAYTCVKGEIWRVGDPLGLNCFSGLLFECKRKMSKASFEYYLGVDMCYPYTTKSIFVFFGTYVHMHPCAPLATTCAHQIESNIRKN